MSSRVTQCPKCQTSFRVTDAQLDIANGAVRCGSCLHIFNAPSHWLGANTAASKTIPSTTSTKPSQTSFDNLDDDDFLIDDNSELFFDDEDNSPKSILFNEDDENEYETTFKQPKNNGDQQLSESFLELDSDNWDDDFDNTFTDQNHEEDDGSDDWATQLLDEDNEEIISKPVAPSFDLHPDMLEDSLNSISASNKQPSTITAKKASSDSKPIAPLNDADQWLDSSADTFSAGDRITNSQKTSIAPPIRQRRLVDNIEPEPLELAVQANKRRHFTSLWSIAIVLGLLGLPGQYINYHFDDLARHPDYRPLLTAACKIIGCQLPPNHNISLIQSSNLIVRSHPNSKNALVVDAIITNRANFEQSFPLLELTFTDINGNIIAGRRFNPAQYLSGELLGSQQMPSRRPIHISLEILDPGTAAINYEINFRASEG